MRHRLSPKFGLQGITERYRRALPLNPDSARIALTDSDAPREAPVQLEIMDWSVTGQTTGADATRFVDTRRVAYRLHPAADAAGFEWWFISWRAGSGFRIVPDDAGTSYLTWSWFGNAEVADITRPRSRQAALDDCFAARMEAAQRGILQIPVCRLAGARPFLGRDTLNPYTQVRSIRRVEAGGWEVEVCGVDPKKVFTFVSADGQEWSLKGPPPAPARPATPAT